MGIDNKKDPCLKVRYSSYWRIVFALKVAKQDRLKKMKGSISSCPNFQGRLSLDSCFKARLRFESILNSVSHRGDELACGSLPKFRITNTRVLIASSNAFTRFLLMHRMLRVPPTMVSAKKNNVPILFCVSNAIPLVLQTLKKLSSCVDFNGSCAARGIYTNERSKKKLKIK